MSQPRLAATSARTRLRARGKDFQRVLVRYGLERMLYRLSIGAHADQFILKGAMLFALWGNDLEHRPTKDVDLLGYGDPSPERLVSVFKEVCAQPVNIDDGLDFEADSVTAEPIRANALYDGVRVLLVARLGKAKIRIQIDVGYGDAITPCPVRVCYPTLLDHPAPDIRAYPATTAIAEKLEAMVSLGMVNSRMKDFFDVAWCATHLAFDGAELVSAVRATFERRGTALPERTPVALTAAFANDDTKVIQWRAFVRKLQLSTGDLAHVIGVVSVFLLPVLDCATSEGHPGKWEPPGLWSERNTVQVPLADDGK